MRFTLALLLLWLSCCAVYFALARHFLTGPPKGLGQWLLLTGLSAYTGVCWATVVVILLQMVRGGGDPVEPGQWLLFCVGMVLALDIMIRWLPNTFLMPREAVMAAGTCGVVLLPTLSRHLPVAWKRFFILLVLIYAVPVTVIMFDNMGRWPLTEIAPGQLLDYWQRSRRMIILLAALWVLVCDYRAARHGSWWHYFGVVSATILWVIGSPSR